MQEGDAVRPSGKNLIVISMIALLVIPAALPLGYAVSGIAESTSQPSDTAYLKTGIYSYDPDSGTYSPAPSYALNYNNVRYQKSGYGTNITYSVNDTVKLSMDNLYVRTDGYNIQGTCTFTPSVIVLEGGSSFTTLLFSFRLYDGYSLMQDDGYGSYTLEIGKGYGIELIMRIVYSGRTIPDLFISANLTSDKISDGRYLADPLEITHLKVHDNQSASEIIQEYNPSLGTGSSSYEVSDEPVGDHGDYPAANISNVSNDQGGISNPYGSINLSLTIPQEARFVFYLQKDTNYQPQLTITIKRGSQTILNETFTMVSGACYVSTVKNPENQRYSYPTLERVDHYNAWIVGDSADIQISIRSSYGNATKNLKMDIVFLPPS